jgi:hypothetical protein
MGVSVKEFTVPEAGIDTVDITIEETYEVKGVGQDTVQLKGTLVADRTAPLIGPGKRTVDWETSTVVARFTHLDVRGKSDVFGPVRVVLDRRMPSFGVVKAGACQASLSVVVTMPEHNLTLRSAEPVQLQSDVTTVPPIGNERTVSIRPTKLVDHRTGRALGTLEKARVVWRELEAQVDH